MSAPTAVPKAAASTAGAAAAGAAAEGAPAEGAAAAGASVAGVVAEGEALTALTALTTGVDALDELIDGVRVGDNLVVLADDRDVLASIGAAFGEAVGATPLVVATADESTVAAAPDHALVLDHRGGDEPVDVLLGQLAASDEQVGTGAAFLVDLLADVRRRHGTAAALELFLTLCPRLYRRGSVALWLVDANDLDEPAIARLRDITQVVVRLSTVDGDVDAEVQVAAGRAPTIPGRRRRLRLGDDGRLVEAGEIRRGPQRLGAMVRRQRTERGLSQSELARRVGISASAISQLERGARGIGGETLMRIWEVLGVPFGPDDTLQRGYRIGRRSAHRTEELAPEVTGRLLADDATIGRCWQVTVAPGARGSRSLFVGRVRESVVLDRGVLEVEVGGHREVLHEGDSLLAPQATIDAWHNPGPAPAVATWWVLA